MKIKLLITITITTIIQGCSIMPYQEESSCRFNEFGKCLPIDEAYKEATTSIDQGGVLVNGKTQNVNAKVVVSNKQIFENIDLKNQLIYQKTQSLVKPIESPLLQPAVVRRVFINSRRSVDSSMWHEVKNIYYIEKKPQWTLELIKQHKYNKDTFNLFK